MLTQTVKASAVTHLTDARYFAAWEVNYLGFDLSPDGVSSLELHAFREWIEGPKIVGELDAGLPARIEAGLLSTQTLVDLKLDAVQVDAIFQPENVSEYLQPLGIPVFLEIPVEGYLTAEDLNDTIEQYAAVVTTIIFNFNKGGITWADLQEGHPLGLSELRQLSQQHNIFLEIEGASPSDVMKDWPELSGFSVRGGSEEKVGYKDFDDLDLFFEDIEG
jgi:phosphoribosylanthranilate isomerase